MGLDRKEDSIKSRSLPLRPVPTQEVDLFKPMKVFALLALLASASAFAPSPSVSFSPSPEPHGGERAVFAPANAALQEAQEAACQISHLLFVVCPDFAPAANFRPLFQMRALSKPMRAQRAPQGK